MDPPQDTCSGVTLCIPSLLSSCGWALKYHLGCEPIVQPTHLPPCLWVTSLLGFLCPLGSTQNKLGVQVSSLLSQGTPQSTEWFRFHLQWLYISTTLQASSHHEVTGTWDGVPARLDSPKHGVWVSNDFSLVSSLSNGWHSWSSADRLKEQMRWYSHPPFQVSGP